MTTLHKTALRIVVARGRTGATLLASFMLLSSFCFADAQDAAGVMPPNVVHNRVDWRSLNLNMQQNQQIEMLEHEWNNRYVTVMPQIHRQQRHLQELFRNPHSDPVDIVNTQQSISHMQEQLRSEAMANYLRKRAVLNEPQQRLLQSQLQQMVIDRQQRTALQPPPGEEQNGGIMNIMQKVRWAIAPH